MHFTDTQTNKKKTFQPVDFSTESVLESPVVQIALIFTVTLAGIYLLGKSLRIVGTTVKDVKYFIAAIKN